MKHLYLLTFFIFTLALFCKGQTVDSNIEKLNDELGLERIEKNMTWEILTQLSAKLNSEEFAQTITGDWTYEYSIKSTGSKYKSKNAIKKFHFKNDGVFFELRKSLTDTIKGVWSFQQGILELRFSEPYFENGKPTNIESMSDYEISLISLANEIHIIHRIDDTSLFIISSVTIPGDDKFETVRFKVYKKAVANN